jgi:hypothetical protein
MAFAVLSTIGLAALTIIYYQAGVGALFPLANTGGPFSWIIGWVTTAAPLAIVVMLLAVWAWAFASPVQDEAAIRRFP